VRVPSHTHGLHESGEASSKHKAVVGEPEGGMCVGEGKRPWGSVCAVWPLGAY